MDLCSPTKFVSHTHYSCSTKLDCLPPIYYLTTVYNLIFYNCLSRSSYHLLFFSSFFSYHLSLNVKNDKTVILADLFCMLVHSCWVEAIGGDPNAYQTVDESGCAIDKHIISKTIVKKRFEKTMF